MTLAEVMVASIVLTWLLVSFLTTILQSRRISENNVAQATAAVVAEGIIEQVQWSPYANIQSGTILTVKFANNSSTDLSSLEPFDLQWGTDTDIGARSDPLNAASPKLGVLIDLDYMNGSTVIRPRRYMKMKVNLTRVVSTINDNIGIILTYSWQPPSGLGLANAPYITREIRTVRSQAPSY